MNLFGIPIFYNKSFIKTLQYCRVCPDFKASVHYVNDPVLRGSAIPDFEALVVLFRMVEVYSEVINAHLHVIRAQRLR